MMRILALLRDKTPPTSAALREALAQAEAERGAAAEALDRLSQKRADALLDADDHMLDVLEADIRSAQRQVDRLDLLSVQAEEKLREAVERERRAELDAAFAEDEALVDEAVGLIKRSYPTHTKKLLALVTRLQAIEATRAELNRRLAEGGDPCRIPDPDQLARPGEPADLAWSATSMRQRFWDQIALPSSDEWYRLMLPPMNAFGRSLRPDEGSPDR
jgi:hypothetical protein